jgi:hypothetical protein
MDEINLKKPSILISLFFIILSLCLLGSSSSSAMATLPNTLQLPIYINHNPVIQFETFSQTPVPILLPQPHYNETVVIIVDSTLWINAAIQTAVNNYRTDLNNSGYQTILHTSAVATVQALRTLLQGWYTTHQITGAVLIGPLPYAWFYHPASGQFLNPETFACDLYLMDLDGSWWDLNTDTVYDKHNASTGADIYPEIYVGRIDATTRTLGGQSNANNILSLLGRHSSYRRGGVARTHRAITYIDDDWSTLGWSSWLNNAYSNRTDVFTPTTWTNGTDWLNNRLIQDYEFAHLCAHSSAQKGPWPDARHYFGTKGVGEGQVTEVQIHGQQPTFNFYNLFACSGADWSTPDSLGMTYLYSSAYSLAVIGTTKTGGMLSGTSLYNSLGNNKTLGQALSDWFQGITTYAGQYLEWFYGMTLMGDPFLTIYYDCTVLPTVITSVTHPTPGTWYSNQLPQFNWTVPGDVNGITGYYYIIDQNPSTTPTAATGTWTTTNGTQPTTPLVEGTWFLHVVGKDGAGNVGSMPTHYQINIDASGPSISITNPTNLAIVPSTFTLNWSASDAGSGYYYADIFVNGILDNTVYGLAMNTTISGLADGVYTISVTAYDNMGNGASDQISITVQTIPPIPGFPIEAIAVGTILALGLGLFYRRRMRLK